MNDAPEATARILTGEHRLIPPDAGRSGASIRDPGVAVEAT